MSGGRSASFVLIVYSSIPERLLTFQQNSTPEVAQDLKIVSKIPCHQHFLKVRDHGLSCNFAATWIDFPGYLEQYHFSSNEALFAGRFRNRLCRGSNVCPVRR